MIFAATLAAFRKQSSAFEQSGEPIAYEIFARYSDHEALFYVLSIFGHGNLSELSEGKSDERLTTFENYASAGLEIIERAIKANPGKPHADVIIQLIGEAEAPSKPTGDINLARLVDELGGRRET